MQYMHKLFHKWETLKIHGIKLLLIQNYEQIKKLKMFKMIFFSFNTEQSYKIVLS